VAEGGVEIGAAGDIRQQGGAASSELIWLWPLLSVIAIMPQ
jgi:hypothetical protein